VQVEAVEVVPTLDLQRGWEAVLDAPVREALERTVIPPFLRAQRWFGGKARRIEAVRFVDWAPLQAVPRLEHLRTFLALVEVAFGDGATDLYFLPLGVATGPAAVALSESLPACVLARLRGPGGEAVLHDALADDGACAALLGAIAAGQEFPTRAGRIRAFPTAAFAGPRGRADVPLPATLGPATSSNSLVLYGRRLLLKLFRRLEVGINPDFEVGRFLTEKGGFGRIPKVAGALEYHRPGSGPVTLAILQALVPHQGDGWGHAIAELGRYFERASGRMRGPDPVAPDDRPLLELAASDPPPGALETIGAYLHAAATLGRRTAELHLALADDRGDPAFTPEPLTAADLAALAAATLEQGHQALTALRDNLGRLPEELVPAAQRLLDEGPAALAGLGRAPAGAPAAVKTRCHGDYHLGQVLWVDNDFVILDFEGEPTRTVAERRARQSPLKDVAGMLRSFDYAAHAGLFAFTQSHPDDFGRLGPWAVLWRQWTSAAFLREYRATAGGAAFLPAEPGALAALLDTFMLDKAFYELVYELNNRPDWVRIPLQGILSLLEQGHRAAGRAATKGSVP
jgi:maltose alpha-D-glucosyltransferase/alpha-amylase